MVLQNIRRFLVLALLCSVTSVVFAATTEVTGVRLWTSPEQTRLVLDTTDRANYRIFRLRNPHRVVIDVKQAEFKASLPEINGPGKKVLSGVRGGVQKNGTYRFVLDVEERVNYKDFTLLPTSEYGHRVVIELDHPNEIVPANEPIFVEKTPEPILAKPVLKAKTREIVVAIDAGHGGEDPGANGKFGTKEKDVVLDIARRLHRQLEMEPGIRPVLIRDDDYYLSLRKRIKKAREHKADLFISIHADAFRNRKVKGSSVYVLSTKSASDEAARWLAERENAADLVGGVSLDDKDDILAQVLLDLSLTGTIDVSTTVADSVLKEIGKVGPVHKSKVQSAGFVVLKSPDIPSLLVETAFISNPREERRLKDAKYQDRLAKAIRNGVKQYFQNNPPPGTLYATRGSTAHVIKRGETLSGIASNYQVSMGQLIELNSLASDLVRAGQVIQIPRI